MTPGPDELYLHRNREVRWMLVPAAAVLAVGIAAIVYAVFDDDQEFGFTAPVLGPLAMGLLIVALWVIFSMWLRTNEKRHAEATLADAIAEWPQYSTTAQWDKDVEKIVAAEHFDRLQVIGPAVVFSIVALFIAGVTALSGDTTIALFVAVGGIAVVSVGAGLTIAVRTMTARRAEALARRRLGAIEPYPRCWVSAEAAYFEDYGLVRFHQLREVNVVAPGQLPAHRKELEESGRDTDSLSDLTPLDTRLSKSGWAHLAATSDSRMLNTIWLRLERMLVPRNLRHRYWVDTMHVRIPPDDVDRADDVAAAIRRRWLG